MMVFDACEEWFEEEWELEVCAALYCSLGDIPALAFFAVYCVNCVLQMEHYDPDNQCCV